MGWGCKNTMSHTEPDFGETPIGPTAPYFRDLQLGQHMRVRVSRCLTVVGSHPARVRVLGNLEGTELPCPPGQIGEMDLRYCFRGVLKGRITPLYAHGRFCNRSRCPRACAVPVTSYRNQFATHSVKVAQRSQGVLFVFIKIISCDNICSPLCLSTSTDGTVQIPGSSVSVKPE